MNSIKNKGKVIKMNLSESHKREIAPLCFRVKFSHKKIISLLILLVGLNVIFHSGLLACPIPVFRYALEYWETDNYILDVYYKNELEPGDKALIDLVKSPRNSATRSNLDIRLINVDDDNPDASVIRDKNLQAKSFPWMVLRYPIVTGIKTTLWSGPLNQPNMEKIIHSPVRENLIRLLAKETTAVWILLESGDKKKDQEAYDILSKDLKHLEQTLTLPDPELWWDQSKGIPLEDVPPVKFDILRLSRLNPVEEHFIRMLLNSEPDLHDFASEPIVFPVFGRGIALYAIVGKGINEWNIREAAEFIIGPCSCQAKILNPGVDMLTSVAWDKLINNVTDINLSNPLSGLGDFGSKETEVKRLLEEVTNKHISTKIEKTKLSEPPEKNPPDYTPAVSDPLSLKEKKKAFDDIAKEETISKSKVKEISVTHVTDDSPKLDRPDEPHEKKDFLETIAIYLTGLVLIILIIGIILYRKSFR